MCRLFCLCARIHARLCTYRQTSLPSAFLSCYVCIIHIPCRCASKALFPYYFLQQQGNAALLMDWKVLVRKYRNGHGALKCQKEEEQGGNGE